MSTQSPANGGKGVRISNAVVGAIMGAGLLWATFQLVGWKWGAALSLLLLYEGWTLVNNYRDDTLSESIWRFAKRPMVPWLFGLGTGYALGAQVLTDGVLMLGIGFLSGHFFFSKQCAESDDAARDEYFYRSYMKRLASMPDSQP